MTQEHAPADARSASTPSRPGRHECPMPPREGRPAQGLGRGGRDARRPDTRLRSRPASSEYRCRLRGRCPRRRARPIPWATLDRTAGNDRYPRRTSPRPRAAGPTCARSDDQVAPQRSPSRDHEHSSHSLLQCYHPRGREFRPWTVQADAPRRSDADFNLCSVSAMFSSRSARRSLTPMRKRSPSAKYQGMFASISKDSVTVVPFAVGSKR
jgi:hypothetical protein